MQGYLSIILHAHLPFVRHPEHDKFLEESWLFEAVTETYLPLIQIFENWRRDQLPAHITLSLSPTLCAMLLELILELARVGYDSGRRILHAGHATWSAVADSRYLSPRVPPP